MLMLVRRRTTILTTVIKMMIIQMTKFCVHPIIAKTEKAKRSKSIVHNHHHHLSALARRWIYNCGYSYHLSMKC